MTVMGTYPTIPQRWTCPTETYSPNLARSGETPSQEDFLFSSVGAVPGWYEAASLNGWLECHPWSQDR